MDSHIIEASDSFSNGKFFGKTEYMDSKTAEDALAILSEANQRILASIQKSSPIIGFIVLELENLNELMEKLDSKHLSFTLKHITKTAVEQFPRFFKKCRLQFYQQIGLNHFMLCFTAAGISKVNLLNSHSQYEINVNRVLNQHIRAAAPLKYAVAVGMSLLESAQMDLDPNMLVFQCLCEAKKIAKQGEGKKRLSLYNEFSKLRARRSIKTLFQPVIALQSGRLIGWAAFSKGPPNSPFESPMGLYAFAERYREARSLDHMCRCLAVQAAGHLSSDRCLFLNLHYSCLQEPECQMDEFMQAVQDQGLKNRQIVLELDEQKSILVNDGDSHWLLERLDALRNQGVLLAMKNVGAAGSNLPALSRIRPDFIKMDISMSRGIETNAANRVTVEILARLAEKIGARLIAEGIEQLNELSALTAIGVNGGQGVYFAEPMSAPAPVNPKIVVNPLRASARNEVEDWKNSTPIRELVRPGLAVDISTSISRVKKLIGEDSPMSSVVVTESKKPVGLLMSYRLDSHLSTLYGPSLYYHRPVSAIMDRQPQLNESYELVERVAKKAMNREDRQVYDDIIVVEKGVFLGTVSVQNMLDAMAKVQVELAKGANPLTGLPGNVMIEMEIKRREKQQHVSSFLYLDLDNFKVYNDVYGFRNGDQVLKMTAEILNDAVSEAGTRFDFIGHIGGDDFFIVTDPDHAEAIAQQVIRSFAEQIPAMYNETDQKCGYILGVSRDGREGKFPFVSVSIGIIDCTFEYGFSLEALSARAADVKKYAKSKAGNAYLRDRRPALGAMPQKGAN